MIFFPWSWCFSPGFGLFFHSMGRNLQPFFRVFGECVGWVTGLLTDFAPHFRGPGDRVLSLELRLEIVVSA